MLQRNGVQKPVGIRDARLFRASKQWNIRFPQRSSCYNHRLPQRYIRYPQRSSGHHHGLPLLRQSPSLAPTLNLYSRLMVQNMMPGVEYDAWCRICWPNDQRLQRLRGNRSAMCDWNFLLYVTILPRGYITGNSSREQRNAPLKWKFNLGKKKKTKMIPTDYNNTVTSSFPQGVSFTSLLCNSRFLDS